MLSPSGQEARRGHLHTRRYEYHEGHVKHTLLPNGGNKITKTWRKYGWNKNELNWHILHTWKLRFIFTHLFEDK